MPENRAGHSCRSVGRVLSKDAERASRRERRSSSGWKHGTACAGRAARAVRVGTGLLTRVPIGHEARVRVAARLLRRRTKLRLDLLLVPLAALVHGVRALGPRFGRLGQLDRAGRELRREAGSEPLLFGLPFALAILQEVEAALVHRSRVCTVVATSVAPQSSREVWPGRRA